MTYGFHPEALAEYEAATLHYMRRDRAIAERFVAAIDDAVDRILEPPTRWRLFEEASGVV
jgi:toxin ParE1/3/4